jgi:hypothetical protein
VSLESENASDELDQRAKIIMKISVIAVEDAEKIFFNTALISVDRCCSSHSLMKSIEISNKPSTCVTTMSIGTADIKKKYAICAAKPA